MQIKRLTTNQFSGGSLSFAMIVCLLATLLNGCSRSKEMADTAPVDIRGERINAPISNSITAGSGIAFQTLPPTNAATSALIAAPAKPTDEQNRGVTAVTFDKLASFEFVMPDETVATNGVVSTASKGNDQFPAAVKALDQARVALKGFMLPLKVESGLVTELLIMRDQSMCCYGKVPKITEWVSVKMTNKGVKAVIDQPITIFGKLHVGEMRENGYLVGIYRMDGDSMTAPE